MGGRPNGTARRGFTFLEVMMVVLVMGLAFAVTLPNLRPAERRQKLGLAARDLVGLMRFARTRAIATQRYTWLDFKLVPPLEVWYGNAAIDDLGDRPEWKRRAPDEQPLTQTEQEYEKMEFPEGMRMEISTYPELFYENNSRVRLYFYPDGKASRCTVTLLVDGQEDRRSGDRSERAYTIELYRATGMVQSHTGRPADAKDIAAQIVPLAGRRARSEDYSYLFEEKKR